MLLLFGGIYGNDPSPVFGGYGTIDVSTPSFICMITGVTGLMSLPMTLCTYRENKVLKRLKATGLHPAEIIGVHFAVNFFMTLLGIAVLMVLAKTVYDVQMLSPLRFIVPVILLIIVCIFSIGTLIASLFNNAKTAIGVANLVYFPMIFLSGATIPIEIMPETMQKIAKVLPMTHAVVALKGVWLDKPFDDYSLHLWILSAIALLCIGLSVKFFRWE